MRELLERLEKSTKYNDFVSVLEEWRRNFEEVYNNSGFENELQRIYYACWILKRAGSIVVAEKYLYGWWEGGRSEKGALFVLISDAVMSNIFYGGRKKEEVFEEIDRFIEEAKYKRKEVESHG